MATKRHEYDQNARLNELKQKFSDAVEADTQASAPGEFLRFRDPQHAARERQRLQASENVSTVRAELNAEESRGVELMRGFGSDKSAALNNARMNLKTAGVTPSTMGSLGYMLGETDDPIELNSALSEVAGVINSPDYSETARAGMTSLAVAAKKKAADLEATRLANLNNNLTLERGGMSAPEAAKQNETVRGIQRGLQTMTELQNISTMDVNRLQGGGATLIRYLQKTLEPAIMDIIKTGVINSQTEQDRINSYNAQIAGWGQLTTFGTTQQAQLNEMTRWFSQMRDDKIRAWGLDPNGFGDSFQPRGQEEIALLVESFDKDVPTAAQIAELELTRVEPDTLGTIEAIADRAIFPRGGPGVRKAGAAVYDALARGR